MCSKMSMRRVPPKFYLCGSFFIESLSKKFSGSGTPKIDVRNFCQLEKNVFFENWDLGFFEKSGKWGYFGGCAPIFFLQKLTNIGRFQFKIERVWRRTRGVIGPYFSLNIFTKHGSIWTGTLMRKKNVWVRRFLKKTEIGQFHRYYNTISSGNQKSPSYRLKMRQRG